MIEIMEEDLVPQLKKYFRGEASEEEKNNILHWLTAVKNEKVVKKMMEFDWEDVLGNDRIMTYESSKIWNAIEQQLHLKESSSKSKNILVKETSKPFVYSTILKVAAMLIFCIGLSYALFFQTFDKQQSAAGIITKEAPANAAIHFKLPDGSTIYLNKSAKLSFHKDFSPRNVTLEGEGFFEIAKDSKHPFQVHISNLIVKVLGTTFNISSSATSPKIKVYLLEGSVSIQEKKQTQIIKPGQIAIYSKQTSKFTIEKAITNSNIVWTGRKLIFKNDPLPVVMKKLETRYLISTRIVGLVDKNCLFNAVIGENDSLNTVLELIKISSNSTFTVKGDSVIVYSGSCR